MVSIAQEVVITGVVIDQESTHPIPWVGVGIVGEGVGTVSDENGRFSLSISSTYQGHKLTFSHINYQPAQVGLSAQSQQLKVLLKPVAPRPLPEIELYPSKTVVLGQEPKGKSLRAFFEPGALGCEAGTLVRNDGTSRLNVLSMNILENRMGDLTFRLNFYAADKDEPGKKLRGDTVFLIPKDYSGILTLDLQGLGLVIEGNFVASIELLKMENVDPAETLYFSAYAGARARVYRKLASMAHWSQHRKVGLCFWIEAEQ